MSNFARPFLSDLRFDPAVLFIFLRQDESLDSPHLASIGESRRDNALNPIMGQGNFACFLPQLRLHWRELTPVCCQFDDPHFPLHGFAIPWEVGFLNSKKL